MKQWYVLLEDLTDEQEAELVRLMEGNGGIVHSMRPDNCLGCSLAPNFEYIADVCLDYWNSKFFNPQDQITFEEARGLLS